MPETLFCSFPNISVTVFPKLLPSTDRHSPVSSLSINSSSHWLKISKAYNPKEADRLGIVYTPNEIVKFMVQSTDYLLTNH